MNNNIKPLISPCLSEPWKDRFLEILNYRLRKNLNNLVKIIDGEKMNADQFQAEVMDELKQRMIINNDAENGKYDDEYAEYLMKHPDSSRPICNGDMLIAAMEDGYLWNDFIDYLVKEKTQVPEIFPGTMSAINKLCDRNKK